MLSLLSAFLLFWAFKSIGKRRGWGACFLLGLLWSAFAMGHFSKPSPVLPSSDFIGVVNDCKDYKNNWKVLNCISLEDGQAVVLRGRHRGSIQNGDTLIATHLEFKEPPLPSYLGEFNQQAYLAGKGIHFEAFFKTIHTQKATEAPTGNQLDRWFSAIPERHRPLVKGMLTGDKSDLSKETKQAFKACGIMHILAVSGMHVGLLSAIPMWLISRISLRRKTWRYLLQLVTITGIWSFAWFVGMGPSVVRASIMFSLLTFALSKSLVQRFNVLCLTAWFMLVIQPNWLYDIGFQLSFSAVFGIFFIAPKFQALYKGCNKWLSKILDAISISLGAQLATTPLVLYYFHEFPSYFLLGNLLVAPLLIIGIYLSLLVLVLFAIGIQWEILTGMLDTILNLAMWLSTQISLLPHTFLKGFFLSSSAVIFCYAFLLWALKRNETRGNTFYSLSRWMVVILSWMVLIGVDAAVGMPMSEQVDDQHLILHSNEMTLLVTKGHRESNTYLSNKLEEIHAKPCKEIQLSRRQWLLLMED